MKENYTWNTDGMEAWPKRTRQEVAKLEKSYGRVVWEGREVYLVDQPEPTSGVINEVSQEHQWGGAGLFYFCEYSVDGYYWDSLEPVTVFYLFKVGREGTPDEEVFSEGAYPHEMLEEDYDWDDVYNVEFREDY